jgi:hypothetical protein
MSLTLRPSLFWDVDIQTIDSDLFTEVPFDKATVLDVLNDQF